MHAMCMLRAAYLRRNQMDPRYDPWHCMEICIDVTVEVPVALSGRF